MIFKCINPKCNNIFKRVKDTKYSIFYCSDNCENKMNKMNKW